MKPGGSRERSRNPRMMSGARIGTGRSGSLPLCLMILLGCSCHMLHGQDGAVGAERKAGTFWGCVEEKVGRGSQECLCEWEVGVCCFWRRGELVPSLRETGAV
ncbi:hypothetical protein GOODEAATRI_028857 [Goodea atripinnis]|uniref:Uncharacterized protein n=1 Tax=Goodea atripinnis TaxID=208336 RepID=A0ABV0NRH2_9TELE